MRKLTNLETGETVVLPGYPINDDGQQSASHAVTLRDYFAAAAMQGLLASYAGIEDAHFTPLSTAEWAYRAADAMLKERAK